MTIIALPHYANLAPWAKAQKYIENFMMPAGMAHKV
jgi:hypothetical protein